MQLLERLKYHIQKIKESFSEYTQINGTDVYKNLSPNELMQMLKRVWDFHYCRGCCIKNDFYFWEAKDRNSLHWLMLPSLGVKGGRWKEEPLCFNLDLYKGKVELNYEEHGDRLSGARENLILNDFIKYCKELEGTLLKLKSKYSFIDISEVLNEIKEQIAYKKEKSLST